MEHSDSPISLLYVDDEDILLRATKKYLEQIGGCTVDTASSAGEALRMIQEQEYDVIVSDYQMPEIDGLELLRTLRADGNDIPFIIFTGRGREEVAIAALNAGADYYLMKGGKANVQFGELLNFTRKAVEKRQTEVLYQTVFENTGTAMMVLEEDTTISRANNEMENLWGYSRKELEGNVKWPELVYEEDLKKMLEYHRLRRIDPGMAPKNYEFRIIHKSGEIRTIALTITMISGTKKSVASVTDITRQKEEEYRLKLTQFTMDHASEGIFWANPAGQFFLVNKSGESIFGFPKDELFTMTIPDLAPSFPDERFREYWNNAKKKGSVTFETTIPKKSGGDVIVEINVVFLNFEGQEFECGFVRDITERKHAENALKTLNNKLNLLSSITRHDIINQVGAAQIYLEIMEMDGEIPPDSKAAQDLKTIEGILQTIERQIVFTRDYQDIGINSPEWCRVGAIVDHLASHEFENLTIKSEVAALEIYADPLCEKAIFNLFENAVRHGEHVTEIHVSFHETENQGVLVIEDDGVGIAGDMKENIFNHGIGKNNGFGLFLVREIFDITGISITETGTEGKGARFEIAVPAGRYRFETETKHIS